MAWVSSDLSKGQMSRAGTNTRYDPWFVDAESSEPWGPMPVARGTSYVTWFSPHAWDPSQFRQITWVYLHHDAHLWYSRSVPAMMDIASNESPCAQALTSTTQPRPSASDKARVWHCSQCRQAFKKKEHLVRHTQSHTKQKPFVCSHCPKAYSRRYTARRFGASSHPQAWLLTI